jgi:DNA-binding SARP family transcriptional activator
MAPPIPGLRPPVRIRHRTAGDVLAGVVAVVALTALTIGVPIALITVVGLPLPHTMPSASALTSQLDVTSILRILSVVIWLAWVQLVWCVLVEIKAAVSNVGVPSRVPLAGATQSAVHRLVTAALLLFTAAAALAPAVASPGPARPVPSISAQVTPGVAQNTELTTRATPPQAAPNADKAYRVEPPVGRFHESLWEIAQNHLGDGRRYREIFELNKGRVQPDGTKLTIASLIRPGWVLLMPKDAHGPGIEAVTPKLASELGLDSRASTARGADVWAGDAPAGNSTSGVTAGNTTGGDTPGVVLPGTGGSAGSVPEDGIFAAPDSAAHQVPAWPFELSSASLLAAGVLVALGRRRREQLWRRAFGRRIAGPDPDAALAEKALRLGADDPAVRRLDTGLRYLSQQLAAADKTPPTVFAAHLGAENLDLWIAPPDPNPPRPWQAADGGQVWRLPYAAVAGLDLPDAAALAPYPGLVSLGTNSSGRILVDLEVAHGLIAVRGPRPVVQAALAALAVELVTNRWSDRMKVTLVGFGDGLTDLSPERTRVVSTLDEVLPELEQHAARIRDAMAAAGLESVLTGRSRTSDAELWAPHYLIMGVPPTQAQAERLLALARSRYRMAAGYVIAGDVRGATWTWDLSPDGRLKAGLLGFDLEAQLLPPEQYAAMIKLFRAASAGADVPLATLNPNSPGAAPAAQLVPGSVMPVEVSLLGQVAVTAPGPIEPDRLALATELVVYLAVHPDGVHPNVLTGAVWPRGVTGEVRDAALSRVHAWLGTDDAGQPNLLTDGSGRLRLGPGVRIDWQVFRAWFARASQAAAGCDPVAEAEALQQALALVEGQFLDGRDPSRYAWLATDDIEYEVTAAIADAAHQLAELRLAAGDPDAAMDAARAGLRLAFNDEMGWRDLLTAAHATGQEHVLRGVVSEISARIALDEVMPRMAPETEALIDELLPSWRTSAA